VSFAKRVIIWCELTTGKNPKEAGLGQNTKMPTIDQNPKKACLGQNTKGLKWAKIQKGPIWTKT
jgi:hypothetical protein